MTSLPVDAKLSIGFISGAPNPATARTTVELAERLARLAPGRLKKSIFTASGTEADETAVVLAQIFTGAQELIALRHGYAGRSLLAQSLTVANHHILYVIRYAI